MAHTHNDKWYQLDNVAKIVPSTARGGYTRVFRIACELNEDVDPKILQEALDMSITGFSHFNCILRRGFFWYYLDARDLHPVVMPDHLNPCSPVYFPGRKNLLYRINYFRNRINLEMFHVLADGTGAFVFFKTIVANYLSIKHNLGITCDSIESSSAADRTADAFKQFYTHQKGLNQLKEMSFAKAYQLKGDPDEDLMPHVIEGTISASRFVEEAHKQNTSVGILTTAIYIAAVIDEMSLRDRKLPVILSVPVNLRTFFPSDTTRNFFGVINISYQPEESGIDLAKITQTVKESFEHHLSMDQITQTMNSYSALEHNIAIQVAPLMLKDLGINKLNLLAKSGVTGTMSNLGRINMPDAAVPYIKQFSGFMTSPNEQVCVMTFGDNMTFGEVTSNNTHEIMLHFFRRLVAMGIPVEIATNDYNASVE